MGSTQIHVPLGPQDHVPPGNYTCWACYLPLKPGVTPEQAFEALQEGLHYAFVQLPWLSGRVWPQSHDAPGWRPGQIEIRHDPVDINGPRPYQLKFNQLDTSLTFDDLKEAAFSTEAFSDESLIWAPFMPDVDSGPEVFVAQANFIPGACILVAGTNHASTDGSGSLTVWRVWAEHCKFVQSKSAPPPTVLPPESSDRTLPEWIWEKEGSGKAVEDIDPETWRFLGLEPPTTKLAEPSNGSVQAQKSQEVVTTTNQRTMKSGVFYVSPSNFTALQRNCAQDPNYSTELSGNDVLCALLWRCLLKARSKAIAKNAAEPTIEKDVLARTSMIFDGRAGFSKYLPLSYLGNLTMIIQSSMPLSSITAPNTSIVSVARILRDNASGINSTKLLEMYTLARSMSDYNELTMQLSGVNDPNVLITSLIMFSVNDISFGDRLFGNDGKPEAFRPLMEAFNRITRVCFILPRLKNGGIEIVLNCFEEEMELLVEDDEFEKYVMFLA